MAKQEAKPVTVNILDHEYKVSCPDDERDALLASARYLDEQMRTIRSSGRIIGLERIAVMAALNITHEMLQKPVAKGTKKSSIDEERIGTLIDKIDRTLHQHLELDL